MSDLMVSNGARDVWNTNKQLGVKTLERKHIDFMYLTKKY